MGEFRFSSSFGVEETELPCVPVEVGDGHARFWLQPVTVAEVRRTKQQYIRRSRVHVEEHEALFLESAREPFGNWRTRELRGCF